MKYKYMMRDLVDDHDDQVKEGVLIGYVSGQGYSLPKLVGCFKPGSVGKPGNFFCLNEVGLGGMDDGNRPHLSKWSVLTISHEQLVQLQKTGELRLAGGNGVAVVRLFVEEE